MKYLFDTDILTHFFHGNSNVRSKLAANTGAIIAISSITWFETLRGRFERCLKAKDLQELQVASKQLEDTFELLSKFERLKLDSETMANFERLRLQKKLKMKRPDMLIACTALAHQAVLVTRNTKDFNQIANLHLENWVD